MDDSPLTRLPPEIRVYIYEFAVVSNSAIRIRNPIWEALRVREVNDEWSFEHFWSGKSASKREIARSTSFEGDNPNPLGLCFTCREVKNEALPVFFSKNAFDIQLGLYPDERKRPMLDLPPGLAPLHGFLDIVSGTKLTQLNLRLDLGTFDVASTANVHRLRNLLKIIASKKPDRIKGTCKTIFGIATSEQAIVSLTVDGWRLSPSLLAASGCLAEQGPPNGRAYQETMQTISFFGMWAKAGWAT